MWKRSLHVGNNWQILAECIGGEGTYPREDGNGSLGCFS